MSMQGYLRLHLQGADLELAGAVERGHPGQHQLHVPLRLRAARTLHRAEGEPRLASAQVTEVMVTTVVMMVMEMMGRWKQTAELGPVPNTELEQVFMAVAVDDDIDLHPKNKRLPAERLGWAAANLVYGVEERPLGAPTPVEVEVWTHEHLRRASPACLHDPGGRC